MNLKLGLISVLLSAVLLSACNDEAAEPKEAAQAKIDNLDDRINYMMAYASAKQMQDVGIEVNPALIEIAIADVVSGSEPRISEEEQRASSFAFQTMRRETAAKVIKNKNKEIGERYFAENAKRDGVITLENGIQYEILESGQGASPDADDKVLLHYEGTLLSGSIFDSLLSQAEPVSFEMKEVLPGWAAVLPLMKEGDRWKVFLPSELAYPDGVQGIEPGSSLIFELRLVSVEKID